MKRIAILLLVAAPLLAQESDRVLRVYALGSLVPDTVRSLNAGGEFPFGPLGPSPSGQEIQEDWVGPSAGQEIGGVTDAVRELVKEVARDAVVTSRPSGHLMVRATEGEHELIARLLDTLQRQCGDPFEIEVRHITVRAGSLDDATRRALATGSVDTAALAKLDARGGARGGVLSAPHGYWTSYRAVRQARYMPEFDVEIAQASAVADPVVSPLNEGILANVRPFLLQDGTVLLRLFAVTGDVERMRRFRIGAVPGTRINKEPLTADVGDVEQADFRGSVVSTQAIVPVGGTAAVVLASAEGGADALWDVLLFTARKAPRPATAGTLTVLPLGALCAVDDQRYLGFGEMSDVLTLLTREDSSLGLFNLGEVADELRGGVEEGFLYSASWLHGGSLLVRSSAGQARQAMATVAAMEREFLRPARVTVRLASDPAGPARGVLGGPVLAESDATFAAYRCQDVVTDYDVEVAQESRIADPIHGLVYGGAIARVTLFRAGPRQWRVGLEMRVMALEPIVEVSHGSTEIGPFQNAPAHVRLVRTVLDVASGGEAVLELGASPYDAGRLYAVVRVDG